MASRIPYINGRWGSADIRDNLRHSRWLDRSRVSTNFEGHRSDLSCRARMAPKRPHGL